MKTLEGRSWERSKGCMASESGASMPPGSGSGGDGGSGRIPKKDSETLFDPCSLEAISVLVSGPFIPVSLCLFRLATKGYGMYLGWCVLDAPIYLRRIVEASIISLSIHLVTP